MSLAEVQVSARSLVAELIDSKQISGSLSAQPRENCRRVNRAHLDLDLVCPAQPLMHRLLHAPDLGGFVQRLFHNAVWRNEVADTQAAVEVFTHHITQRVPTFTTSNLDRKHGSAIGAMDMATPGTHLQPGLFCFALRPIQPDSANLTTIR